MTNLQIDSAELDAERLGSEIRALRKSHGLTLNGLAEASGISVGFLSLVERGIKKPSLSTMQRISRALGVEIGWFFPDEPNTDPFERQYVVRAGYRRRIEYSRLSNTDYLGELDYLLSPTIDGQLALTMMTFKPGGTSGDDMLTHEGEEAGFVLSGELTLEIDGRKLVLFKGDSFGFPGNTPHRYLNEGRETLKILLANTPVIMMMR